MPAAMGLSLGKMWAGRDGEDILEGSAGEIKATFPVLSGALHSHHCVPVGVIKRRKVRCGIHLLRADPGPGPFQIHPAFNFKDLKHAVIGYIVQFCVLSD